MANLVIHHGERPYLVWLDEESNTVQNAEGYTYLFSIATLTKLRDAINRTLEAYAEESLDEDSIAELNSQYRDAQIKKDEEELSKPIAREPQSVFIYLMIDSSNGYHKIGYSKNPKKRERTLQSEKPSIEIFTQYNGFESDETYLHETFADKRVRGEWFDLSADDLAFIQNYFDSKEK